MPITLPKNPKADDLVPILVAFDATLAALDARLVDVGARLARLEELETRRRNRRPRNGAL